MPGNILRNSSLENMRGAVFKVSMAFQFFTHRSLFLKT
eukprot:CAMPEP_0204062878 /NCGR_PEP_ID=MMETSP0360-20130528/145230_1 /ASSEMBLY_ACC=CAM_ASM_000342 /TAXON_ID=268821 /ORGANISM="Scrippsiella Hangoei, Strain SHTV-5" /LENGTH=37 /DNA_ID= /DNA_START= /DNA_END= /DNA_ORIENTATION=